MYFRQKNKNKHNDILGFNKQFYLILNLAVGGKCAIVSWGDLEVFPLV